MTYDFPILFFAQPRGATGRTGASRHTYRHSVKLVARLSPLPYALDDGAGKTA